MENWKTSILGVVGAVSVLLKYTGLDIPPAAQDALTALILGLLGIFTKDFNK